MGGHAALALAAWALKRLEMLVLWAFRSSR